MADNRKIQELLYQKTFFIMFLHFASLNNVSILTVILTYKKSGNIFCIFYMLISYKYHMFCSVYNFKYHVQYEYAI